MFGNWYNSSLRQYIVMMGDMFSGITIRRKRGDEIKLYKVPISYASKEHFAEKLRSINSISSQEGIAKVETILPRMHLHMIDISYHAGVKTGINLRKTTQQVIDGKVNVISQHNPVPVRLSFELGIYTRYEDDMLQIVEQILPYFQPHFVTTITELYGNDVEFQRDVTVTFQSIAIDEQIDGDKMSKRRLEWTLFFDVIGYIYPPQDKTKGEIRTIYLDFFANRVELTDKDMFESVDTQVVPVDVSEEEWQKTQEVNQTYSSDKKIPVDPDPPKPR